MSFEPFVGNVWIAQLDRERISQTSSGGRKCSVAVTTECSWYYAGWNVDGPQRALSAVGHKAAIICRIRRRLPEQRLAKLGEPWHVSLNLTRSRMGSQWSNVFTGVVWSQRRLPVIVAQWRSAQTAVYAVRCLADRIYIQQRITVI